MSDNDNESFGHITFVAIKEGKDVPREIMTEKKARSMFYKAITATNHVDGGGKDGYRELLSFVISWIDADHGDWAVSAVMKELGWERIGK